MKKFFDWIKKLFRNMQALALRYVAPAVATVDNIKRLVDSPLTDIATGIIPGNLDDNIVKVLRQQLPRVLQVLQVSEKCLPLKTFDEIVVCAIAELKKRDYDGRSAAYHSIAALLAHYASDKKISWSEAVHLSELIFTERKKQ